MRVLTAPGGRTGEATDDDLRDLYGAPKVWLRANMISTVDGAGSGGNGLTGTMNNHADHRVFHLLRRMADAIVVGASTALAESYGPAVRPLVLVSRRARLPEGLRGADPGMVLMATCRDAEGLGAARRALGADNVLVLGEQSVDLAALRGQLSERGLTSLLCEGGPRLLNSLLSAALVDELCVTQVPSLLGGQQARITLGPAIDVSLELSTLIESDGTLLGRWLITQPHVAPLV